MYELNIPMHVPNSKDRKAIHEYAEKNNLKSKSYLDKTKEYEERRSFFCQYCKWITDVTTKYCCIDDKGNQACSEFIVVCNKCEEIVWSDDPNGYKMKHWPGKNMIILTTV
jgi:hypothetical protein